MTRRLVTITLLAALMSCDPPAKTTEPPLTTATPPPPAADTPPATTATPTPTSAETKAVAPPGPCVFRAKRATEGDVRFDWIEDGPARAWRMPAEVALSVTARRMGGEIIVTAILRNNAAAPREVVYLTGGEPGSTNPFHSKLTASPRPRPPEPGRPRREVYPAPERVTLPPGGVLTYEHRHCVEEYLIGPDEAVRAQWSFEAWAGQRRTGEVPVTPG